MKSDLQLQQDVMDELLWEPALEAAEIGVSVKEGVVTLSGNVNSYSKKLAAEKAAKRVKDVNAVAVDIHIKLSSEEKRTDEDIAKAAMDALLWNTFVPAGHVKVQVDNGWITLDGELEWQYQKDAAVNAVKDLQGVRGVSNLVQLRPGPTGVIVKDHIKKALERIADVEADRIDIITEGRSITVKGKVRSWSERSEVERAVWATPGVWSVKDELVIAP
ncbi:BON domain-containing protein [Chitinophaga oryziterrae]|uniref:BON domain-containing protein n=1 Tax=Chitinophaga oryziterrae TaxID=1031224 RepID=A0A6N8JF59_9BACT|nr:BON domain-containing protein [Chitinophaga oryziterrae]MVT43016.1 BON domain-containing protein [Chitinophaga oryziterrae]